MLHLKAAPHSPPSPTPQDLVVNRLEKHTDTDGDDIADVTVESVFDENDRLLNEKKILNGVESQETRYDYNVTEQTGKTVFDLINSRIESKTKMEYNTQGRMSKITIETYVNGELAKVITQEYEYNSSGIKVKQTESVDSDADGTIDSTKTTEYLNEKRNHTGYSQVLEERTSEDGGPVKVTTYTIGHDVLAQYDAVNGLLALLTDGHGSTRAVANDLGQILQQYNYDAYGNAHGFDASEALTNLLYSGEQFNAVSGLQYLRARWYNPQSGTFNRLDPFAGNQDSPLSFHKYAYGHMNPVSNVDPSGTFIIAALMQYMMMHSALVYTVVVPMAILTARYFANSASLIMAKMAPHTQSVVNILSAGWKNIAKFSGDMGREVNSKIIQTVKEIFIIGRDFIQVAYLKVAHEDALLGQGVLGYKEYTFFENKWQALGFVLANKEPLVDAPIGVISQKLSYAARVINQKIQSDYKSAQNPSNILKNCTLQMTDGKKELWQHNVTGEYYWVYKNY